MQCLTAGWQLYIQWKNRSTTWEKLSDLNKLHPIKCTEYDVAQKLQAEPAFNWWVSYVLTKREHIISLVKRRNACYLKQNKKFGIDLPKTVEKAHCLNKKKATICVQMLLQQRWLM